MKARDLLFYKLRIALTPPGFVANMENRDLSHRAVRLYGPLV
jgi:hypothetical protein